MYHKDRGDYKNIMPRPITRPSCHADMKTLRILLIFPLVLWIAHPQPVVAETRFVTDEFTVTLRRGAGNDFKIVKVIPTGTRLEEISRQGNDWSQVRADDGTEGWVLSRFLSHDPPARLRVDNALATQKKAEEERDRVKEEMSHLQSRLATLDKLKAELDHISRISADPIAMDKANQQLRKRLVQLEEEIQRLQKENLQLTNQSNTNYFLAGAGVLFLGFLGGLVLRRPRHKSHQTLG